MRRTISGIILFLLLLGMSTFAVQLVKSDPATITVPDDYLTIQEAINNADEGDTVFLRNGTYNFGTSHEGIVVNKTISLIGESREATIIDASGFRHGILITVDNVTVKGLTVKNSVWWGIWIKSSGCHISDNNVVTSTHEGIFLDGREPEVTVKDNTIEYNYIFGNRDCGILIWASCNNQILHNIIMNQWIGIFLYLNASNNIIGKNEVTNNSDSGVLFDIGCSYNTLICNNISYNGLIPDLWWSGVVLNVLCNGNKIVANNICNNSRGVYHYYCSNNTIYHNNFINNEEQVYRMNTYPSMNIWDDDYPSGGNYWSNYHGSDVYKGPYQNLTGSDGTGDTPYVIDDKNVDWYPLMEPYVHPLGDVNYDDEVNMQDIAIVARAYGSYPSNPNWNPEADVNKDGKIDLKDIALVAKDFGK